MSKIKSALELALEQTAEVKVDKEALRKDEITKRGKSAAGRRLTDPKAAPLEKELASLSKDEARWMKNGMLETLLANLILPRYETDLAKLPPIIAALKEIGPNRGPDAKNLDYLLSQYSQLFDQYIQNLTKLEEELRIQWEPRLRQKEQQVRQQTGRTVKLTPEQDAEFSKVLTDELARLDAQYTDVLVQGKEEIRKIIG